ncbi:NUDIX domain-containing protein [Sporosarcina sp. ANT_H38]|uniref:NUDIX hydrolase n=1 Tax=Sporosarcina sp. ANT_H38 TaxID=2597358 RepID=UPI0011F34B48|nr:NUDIX domain-containing protein [Sporosarcina sp. ANT_H38]KAA0955413.1 NUDIX domain-containing protein [Sporosarcina sp. ANT_H38]
MDYIQRLRSMVGNEKVIMVVASAFIFDNENRVLMQKRSDNGQWGFPGGFMELGESVQDTARREIYEETGLKLDEIEVFRIYSGPQYDKTFSNGDQVSLVHFSFICKRYSGDLVESNDESIENIFYSLEELPENIYTDHKMLADDLLSKKQLPIIG